MVYPTANPMAKHDLLCPDALLDALRGPPGDTSHEALTLGTLDELASSIAQSAVPLPEMPPDVHRLATIYTYPDAPTRPKPLSRAPRVWRLVRRGLFDRVARSAANGGCDDGAALEKCAIAVKLPEKIPPGDNRSHQNSKSFHGFVQFLHTRHLMALLACDSAGRIGFVAPTAASGSNGAVDSHAACLHYAPLKEFLSRVKTNYAASAGGGATDGEDEPATWTPQYPPPPEEDCAPCGWDDPGDADALAGGEPATWTPQYAPPPEEECGPLGWDDADRDATEARAGAEEQDGTAGLYVPPGADSTDDAADGLFVPPGASSGGDGIAGLFVPPGATSTDDAADGLFVPPGASSSGDGPKNEEDDNGVGFWGWNNNEQNNSTAINDDGGGWDMATNSDTEGWNTTSTNTETGLGGWSAVAAEPVDSKTMDAGAFHADAGAAAADAFYSKLRRTLGTRADSVLYHMRSFNGWVKATQIAELDPDTCRSAAGASKKKRSRTSPLRVLDLACGKGGDLGKWALHQRQLENYVGVDVARGSLVDAAIRARQMSKRSGSLRRCTFTLADLGEDVPGRRRSAKAVGMQRLLTWNLQSETAQEKRADPVFAAEEGGGIAETDKFDVVSIQFAIHYMMSTRKRARRFFRTVSSLLEVGGNLIATTIDARVVVEKLLGLGLDLHFDEYDRHPDVDRKSDRGRTASAGDDGDPAATVSVGGGVCRLKFSAEMLQKVFQPPKTSEDMFGLQYSFLLTEGSDHASGVGEAVDLPEWLTPVPALEELAKESGLRLEYATNFHTFYHERKEPTKFPQAHNALYNMKVLNKNGSISEQEWEVSRMYIALKFRKVKEPTAEYLGEEEDVCVGKMTE